MKVVIAGYGVEGASNYRYWSNLGHDVVVADERKDVQTPAGVDTILGAKAFEKLDEFDLVVRSPSINPKKIKTNGKIWSLTNEFFSKCPATIIGVTGTKGKGTTCSLITSILIRAGKTVHLVGNIGQPALDVLNNIKADDIVVYELSSFQLWDIMYSPHVAAILMIDSDHLDVHDNLDDYVTAKSRIIKFQTDKDIVVYHERSKDSVTIAKASDAKNKIAYPSKATAHSNNGELWLGEQNICSISDIKILGSHNLDNIYAAIDCAMHFTDDIGAIREAVTNFKGLEHRLELLDPPVLSTGISYVNDSYSSAPAATEAAVKAIDSSVVLMIGGVDRGIDIGEMSRVIASSKNIKHVVVYGQIADRLSKNLKEARLNDDRLVDCSGMSFEQVFTRANELCREGDTLLLSPGAASFDMFVSFNHRGQRFKELVSKLGQDD